MGIIFGVVIGAFMGWVAVKSDVRQKFLSNVALGVTGALGGEIILAWAGLYGNAAASLTVYAFAATVLGSAMLISLARLIKY